MAGIDIVHVPYRGGALAAADVMGGQVQMMIDVMPNAYPLVKGGRVRGLAVTTAQRSPTAPEFPTIAESGLPGFEVSAWDGVLAPAGTPAAVIERLNAAIREALDDPQVREALLARGAQPIPGTPDEFARHIAESTESWAQGRPPVRRQDRLIRRSLRALAPAPPVSPLRPDDCRDRQHPPAVDRRPRLHRHPLRQGRRGHRQDHDQPARGAQRLPAGDGARDAGGVHRRARRRRHRRGHPHRPGQGRLLLRRRPARSAARAATSAATACRGSTCSTCSARSARCRSRWSRWSPATRSAAATCCT